MAKNHPRLQRFRISMRWSIVSLLTLLILFASGLIIAVSYWGNRQSLHFLMDTLMEDRAYRFIDKTTQFLRQAFTLAEEACDELRQANPARDRKKLEEELRDILEDQPYYSAAYWVEGTRAVVALNLEVPQPTATNLLESTEGTESEKLRLQFEEKIIPPAASPSAAFFNSKKIAPVHRLFSQQKAGFTACAWRNAAQGISGGAVCIDIALGDLALYIGSIKIGEAGRAFIVDKTMRLIAAPQPDRGGVLAVDTALPEPTHLKDAGIPEYKAAHAAMEKKLRRMQKKKKWQKNPRPFYFDFKHGDKRYVGTFVPFPQYTGFDWQAGVIVPEDEFFYFIRRNTRLVLASSLVLVLVAVFLGYLFSRRLARPLNELSEEMGKIEHFDLSPGREIISSITDVEKMVNAFNRMRQGLRSFGKFVPTDLVRQIIAAEGEAHLGGEKRQLTVHFSDIEGFTTISESIPPEQLVELLAEYLGEMSRIIAEEKGTVDKYIGDAIMAFWGAPQRVQDHAHCAARAALRCQKRLDELEEKWRAAGRPVFRARVGLNTGEIIVGNMGSAERLNYTAIGDAVNLASRLEGINKYYGTRIIVGQETQKLIANDFTLRLLDFVAVKGKSEVIRIYELIGEKKDESAEERRFITLYEEALAHYTRREWDEAEKKFRTLLSQRNDEASQQMLERIASFRNHPPPPNWQGEYVMTSK